MKCCPQLPIKKAKLRFNFGIRTKCTYNRQPSTLPLDSNRKLEVNIRALVVKHIGVAVDDDFRAPESTDPFAGSARHVPIFIPPAGDFLRSENLATSTSELTTLGWGMDGLGLERRNRLDRPKQNALDRGTVGTLHRLFAAVNLLEVNHMAVTNAREK